MKEEDSPSNKLHRGLQTRHLTMIAIGGSIGTGLFLASGATVATAGPGSALLAYSLMGIMVYFLMTSLGEMASFMPVAGSFQVYGSRFVDPAFGFALGWNYWYNWAITIAVELSAAAIIMHYWYPEIPGIVWSALFLVIIVLLNWFSVKGFGEGEFWFALLKVITVVAFIILGLLMIFGIMNSPPNDGLIPGWDVFTARDAPFVGGVPAFIGVALIVGFSFQGTELIGMAAGESQEPGRTIPRAIHQIFWRILFFYVLSILVIGMLLPYYDPLLLHNDIKNIDESPFTLVFQRAGLAFAAGVMNAVILSAILSAGNSGMFASTRMLYAMACNNMAPRCFARLSKTGIPRHALLMTAVVAALCFLSSIYDNSQVYLWLLYSSGMTGFIAWLGISICHFRFRRAYILQGRSLNELHYTARWFPFGPVFAFVLCILVMLGQNYYAFVAPVIDWHGIIATYIGIPLFLTLWLGYKWRFRTRIVPLRQVDLEYCSREKPDGT